MFSYNIIGDNMKKFLGTTLFVMILSITFGNIVFKSYKKNATDLLEVIKNEEHIYMVLYGSYNNEDKIKTLKLDNYVLENDNGYYRVYVGISKSMENASRIREIYNNLGNSTYIRDMIIDNMDFIDYLYNKELDLNKKSDAEILKIENEIINKYKELK